MRSMSVALFVAFITLFNFIREIKGGSAKVYVGNLSWSTTDDTLRQGFSVYGTVLDAFVMRDRDTGRSRGFGFVTFNTEDEAQGAIDGLNEQELDGRRIKVNIANARGGSGSGSSGYQGGGYQAGGGDYQGGGYSQGSDSTGESY